MIRVFFSVSSYMSLYRCQGADWPASLPPTSHLQILQSLLKEDPSLKARILAHMPTPDLQECLRNLDSTADSIRRSMPRAGVLADAKLHTKIQQYCRQVGPFPSL